MAKRRTPLQVVRQLAQPGLPVFACRSALPSNGIRADTVILDAGLPHEKLQNW
jgi:intracellular sulfur oxidation DsrE/DsrF family protein